MNGFRTDNYNGVSGGFFNPANLGDSRYKIDVNILGINLLAANNNVDFSLGKLSDIVDSDSGLVNKLVGNGGKSSVLVNLAVHTPSVAYRIDENTTVALLTRTRMLFNITDFDGTLINSVSNELSGSGPYTISNSTNMRMNVNAFSEFGAAVGRVLLNQDRHFLKAGATLKYMAGIGNAYFQLNNFKGTAGADIDGRNAYITDASGRIAVGAGGLDINNLGDVDPSFKGSGFGADLGVVYEYRPESLSDNANKYLFKLSAAILDIGSIKYNRTGDANAAYDINIPASQKFSMDAFSNSSSVQDFKNVFDANPGNFSKVAALSDGSYKVSLPTTIQLGADVRAMNSLYVAAFCQLAVSSNETKAYNPQYRSSITITPRYETRMFAAYLPLSYNDMSKTNVGIGLRAGPVYIGSSSIVNAITGSSKQADVYFGFRFGIKGKSNTMAQPDSKS